MRRAFDSEWVKLRRPALVVGVLLTFALLGALTTMLPFATYLSQGTEPGTAGLSMAAPDGWMSGLHESAVLLGVAALVVCASSFAGEYTHGTLRNLLLRQSDRRALLVGKFAALASLLLAGAVVAVIAAAATAFAFAASYDLHTSDWLSGPGLRVAASTTAGLAAALIGYGLVGALLGVVIRTTAAAVGVGVGYVLAVETLLGAAIPDLGGWLPGQLLSTLVSAGSETVGLGAALLRVGCYFAVAVPAAMLLFARRDVTS